MVIWAQFRFSSTTKIHIRPGCNGEKNSNDNDEKSTRSDRKQEGRTEHGRSAFKTRINERKRRRADTADVIRVFEDPTSGRSAAARGVRDL